MMLRARRFLAAGLAAILPPLLPAARALAQEPVVLAPLMVEVLAPRTNDVVGVLIDALGPDGEIDPARLSDEDWAAVETALGVLREQTATMRGRPIRVVAAPGDAIFGEDGGGLSAADVQAMIDADRAGFDYFVGLMVEDIAQMERLAAARDARALWAVGDVLDVKCNACHERFWYPNWDEDAIPPP